MPIAGKKVDEWFRALEAVSKMNIWKDPEVVMTTIVFVINEYSTFVSLIKKNRGFRGLNPYAFNAVSVTLEFLQGMLTSIKSCLDLKKIYINYLRIALARSEFFAFQVMTPGFYPILQMALAEIEQVSKSVPIKMTLQSNIALIEHSMKAVIQKVTDLSGQVASTGCDPIMCRGASMLNNIYNLRREKMC